VKANSGSENTIELRSLQVIKNKQPLQKSNFEEVDYL